MRRRELFGVLLIAISIFLLVVCIIVNYAEDKNETITGQVVLNKTIIKYDYGKGELTFYEKG